MQYTITASSLITRANTYINSIGNRVGNLLWYDYITSAIKALRAGRTLPWTRQDIIFMTYTDVLAYPLPDDFSSLERLSNVLRGRDSAGPVMTYTTEKEFRRSSEATLAIGWEDGHKYLLVRRDGAEDIKLEEFDDEATTYTLSGDIDNPVSDVSNYVSGSAALRFDLYQAVSNNFIISRVLSDPIDVSESFALGKLFCDVYMPTIITGGFKLRIGTDDANYYETPLITKQSHELPLVADWNKLSAFCSEMIMVGSPDLTAITYIAVDCPATGGVISDGFLVDGFYLRVGNSYRLGYNTNKLVKKSSTDETYQSTVTDGANLILWDEDFDDVLLFRILDKAGFFSYRDNDMVKKVEVDNARITMSFDLRYPTQEIRTKTVYYPKRNKF